MRRYLGQVWQKLTIKKKILMFIGAVIAACLISVIFNIWVVLFSMADFNIILAENTQSVELVEALEKEKELFEDYVQGQVTVTYEMLQETMEATYDAVYSLPFNYKEISEERYIRTWSIRNSYEVYVEKREEFLSMGRDNPNYISDRYALYEMQDYLIIYAEDLMTDTLEESSAKYQEKVPSLIRVTVLVIIVAFSFLVIIMILARLMNKSIIVPVMNLADSAKRIADNDFHVEDVQVENQDELGELVHAFNKMKYATSEYITALEEKRKTLDLLHSEELEKLEVQSQLDVIKFDLLKSQVNPHFLFNTLNVIGGMANLEDAHTTEKMIKALSSLFRYNLKTDDIEVPLARELKVVEDYMYLQQMRFGDRITYNIECEVDKDRVHVPAFTFQPLVENAIIHGLSKIEEGGTMQIRIREKKDKLYIFIIDNGRGIKAAELSALKARLKKIKSQEEHRGIGLGNIYRRVHAMYPEGKVEIYSKENAGTVVIAVIPQRNEESYVSSSSGR